ncbi:MAG: 16S rRNA (uracil(1498)-N(3))-methyltransferase [Rhizobiaceae bacterium]
MSKHNFQAKRFFVNEPLEQGTIITAGKAQANYLLNVLRLRTNTEPILVFNGFDGEWLASVRTDGRKSAMIEVFKQVRTQPPPYDLRYLFTPLKRARMDSVIHKGVEMGAGILQPVFSKFSQVYTVNLKKMRSYAIEAAEQCGTLSIPEIREPVKLVKLIKDFDTRRTLIFCDESENTNNPLDRLREVRGKPLSVLIGPEGGFSPEERALLKDQTFVLPIPLGPRILRADTAAVAALAVVQAMAGDWRDDQ